MTVRQTICPEPQPDTFFRIREYATDAFCQSIIAEMDFFFYRICFLYDCKLQSMRFRFHGHMCQKCHAKSNIKIQGIDCCKPPHTEVFKLKHLLFAAEIFFNAPSGKVSQGNIYYVFFGFDFLIGCKHHGMFRNAVNQYKITQGNK